MYQQLSHGEGVGPCDWLLVRVVSTLRADMMTTRIGAVRLVAACVDLAAGWARQRLSRNEWGYVGKHALDKAFLLPGDPGICRLWRPGLRLCIRCSALLM